MKIFSIIKNLLSMLADLAQVLGAITLPELIEQWIGISKIYTLPLALIVSATFIYKKNLIFIYTTLPLNDAAVSTYEQIRGTLWGEAAERLCINNNAHGVIHYLATHLCHKIPLYGKHSPSKKFEKILSSDIKNLVFDQNRAGDLKLETSHGMFIVDLRVKKRDLKIAIANMKSQTGQN